MDDLLRVRAVRGFQRLAEAHARASSAEAAKTLFDRAILLTSSDTSPLKIYDACQRTCVWLCRGEGDRTVVDGGQLPYRDTAQIPLHLWQYCRSLDLPADKMASVENEIATYERMLRWTDQKQAAP